MRDQDDLGFVSCRHVAKEHIRLPLAQDLQVRVRFVDQKDAAGVRVQICEHQKHLLKAPAGKRDVHWSADAGLSVKQVDRPTPGLGGVTQLHGEETVHQLDDSRPGRWVLSQHHQAQVAQHLSRLTLPQQDVDPAGLNNRLLGLDARHRVQQPNVEAGRRLDELGRLQCRLVGCAVHQLVALAAEAHGHRLDLVVMQHAEGDFQRDVLRSGSHRHVVPVVAGAPHRHGGDTKPVETGRSTLPGWLLPFTVKPRPHRL